MGAGRWRSKGRQEPSWDTGSQPYRSTCCTCCAPSLPPTASRSPLRFISMQFLLALFRSVCARMHWAPMYSAHAHSSGRGAHAFRVRQPGWGLEAGRPPSSPTPHLARALSIFFKTNFLKKTHGAYACTSKCINKCKHVFHMTEAQTSDRNPGTDGRVVALGTSQPLRPHTAGGNCKATVSNPYPRAPIPSCGSAGSRAQRRLGPERWRSSDSSQT